MKIGWSAGCLLACAATLSSLAQEPGEALESTSTNSVPVLDRVFSVLSVVPITMRSVFRGEHTWEEWHDSWSENISHRVDYIDHFFGDDILNDDNRDTRLRLRLGVRFDRNHIVRLDSTINLRLELPQLRRRVQIIFDNEVEADDVTTVRDYNAAAKASPPDAGVRVMLKENKRFRLNADAGAHLAGIRSQLFGRMRARYTVPMGQWQLRLQERVELLSRDGFVEASDVIWDRQLPDNALFRIQTSVNWKDKDRGTAPSQSFTYYRILDTRTSWKAGGRGYWPETPYGGNDIYTLKIGYRRFIHSDWLLLEISPGLEFSSDHDYKVNPFIAVILEITFQRDRPLGRGNSTSFSGR